MKCVGFLAAALVLVLSSHAVSGGYDVNGDYYSGLSVKGPGSCVFPPRPVERGPGNCSAVIGEKGFPGGIFNASAVARLGPHLAPTLYFHPLEWTYIDDPVRWILQDPNTTTYGPSWGPLNISKFHPLFDFEYFNVIGPRSTAINMFRAADGGPAKPNAKAFEPLNYTTMRDRAKGAPIDSQGRSTAKVHFTVAQERLEDGSDTNIVRFTYWFFYPFNGCSNQFFGININAQFQGLEYTMCSPGIHEGDWERVTVGLCASDVEHLLELEEKGQLNATAASERIFRAEFAAHSWWSEYFCSLGECKDFFQPDDEGFMRLRAYSGLFSHATYPYLSNLIVYEKITVALVVNVEGVYIGDRTSDKGHRFMPTKENTLWLPLDLQMKPEMHGDFTWARFTGSWGGSFITTEAFTITCLNLTLMTEVPCVKENPAYYFLEWGLSLGKSKVNPEGPQGEIWSPTGLNLNQVQKGFGLTGPLLRLPTYMWTSPIFGTPPVWDGEDGEFHPTCPFEGSPLNATSDAIIFKDVDLYAFLAACVGIIIGCGGLFTAMLCVLNLDDEFSVSAMAEAVRVTRDEAAFLLTAPPVAQRMLKSAPAVVETVHPTSKAACSQLPAGEAAPQGPSPPSHSGSNSDRSGGLEVVPLEHARPPTPPLAPSQPAWTLLLASAPEGRAPAGPVAEGCTPSRPAQAGGEEGEGQGPLVAYAQGDPEIGSNKVRFSWRCQPDPNTDPIHEFYAVRHLGWACFSFMIYIVAVVLLSIGVHDAFKAFHSIYPWDMWNTIEDALVAVVILLGIWQFLMVLVTLAVRNQTRIAFLFCVLPNWCGRFSWAAQCGAILQAVQAGLVMIQVHTVMLIFAFGMIMWVLRLAVQSVCNAVLGAVLVDAIDGTGQDVCLDLSSITGEPNIICGAEVAQVCSAWSYLNLDYTCYGGLLFVLALMMWGSLAVNQYHNLMWMAAMVSVRARMAKALERSKRMSDEAGEAQEPRMWWQVGRRWGWGKG